MYEPCFIRVLCIYNTINIVPLSNVIHICKEYQRLCLFVCLFIYFICFIFFVHIEYDNMKRTRIVLYGKTIQMFVFCVYLFGKRYYFSESESCSNLFYVCMQTHNRHIIAVINVF